MSEHYTRAELKAAERWDRANKHREWLSTEVPGMTFSDAFSLVGCTFILWMVLWPVFAFGASLRADKACDLAFIFAVGTNLGIVALYLAYRIFWLIARERNRRGY
jgi:hypothetical protein